MKILLILFNILLTGLLVWGIADRFGSASRKKTVYTVKKMASGKRDPVQTVPAVSVPVMTAAEQMDALLRANIFNQERCPNTVPGRNARLELSLVGTFKIGDCTGAIIKQKASGNNNFMPFGGGMPFGPRQMGIAGNRGGMANSRGGVQNRGGMANSRGGFPAGGPFNNRNNTAVSSGAYKQYVRLGETLPNGYKLSEVSRNRVVLTRGGDKLELELLDASKNATQTAAARSTNARRNVNTQMLQTLQNMQRMQMFQNSQIMRMMQNNQNSGFSGGGNFGGGNVRSGTSARNRGTGRTR